MSIPLIDGTQPSIEEQIRAAKNGAKANLAASIARDVSSQAANVLASEKTTPGVFAQKVASYALSLAHEILEAYQPELPR